MGFLDKIKAQQAAQKSQPIPRPELKTDDVLIRKVGGVKRDFERGEKMLEKAEAKALGKEGTEAIHAFEAGVAENLAAIAKEANRYDIVLDPSQLEAVNGIMENQVCCLIGPAGSGKTTTTRVIIHELAKKYQIIEMDENGEKTMRVAIAGAAFTGRAAQQFRRVLPAELKSSVSTIHSLLGYAPVMELRPYLDVTSGKWIQKEVKIFRPTFGQACKLPYKVYIFDESGMIPAGLWNEFIDAIHPNDRILLIGDIHQLPPVMGAGVLGFALQKWPTFELRTIHRQAAGNPIIANAHNVLKGRPLQRAENFHLVNSKKGNALDMQTFVRQAMVHFWKKGMYNPQVDAIITPWNKGAIGQIELNDYLFPIFNPPMKDPKTGVVLNQRVRIHTGTQYVEYAVGDKVMITSNISGTAITNGMMGIVKTINLNGKYNHKKGAIEEMEVDFDADAMLDEMNADNFTLAALSGEEEKDDEEDEGRDQRQSSHVLTLEFEGGETYTASNSGDYRRLTFGYVITCHKAQGGEYPNVFIIVHSANGMMLSQEWLYTAITRARANVYIIYNEKGLHKAVHNQRIKGNTLQEKIKNYVIEAKAEGIPLNENPWNVDRNRFPILFNPKKV